MLFRPWLFRCKLAILQVCDAIAGVLHLYPGWKNTMRSTVRKKINILLTETFIIEKCLKMNKDGNNNTHLKKSK